jgi:hypothetical protein
VKEVADIMKQSGDDQLGRRVFLLGGKRRLQSVFGLTDGLANVGGIASFLEQLNDSIDNRFRHRPELPWASGPPWKELRVSLPTSDF